MCCVRILKSSTKTTIKLPVCLSGHTSSVYSHPPLVGWSAGGQSGVVFLERWKTDCITVRWHQPVGHRQRSCGSSSSSSSKRNTSATGPSWQLKISQHQCGDRCRKQITQRELYDPYDPYNRWPTTHDLYLHVRDCRKQAKRTHRKYRCLWNSTCYLYGVRANLKYSRYTIYGE